MVVVVVGVGGVWGGGSKTTFGGKGHATCEQRAFHRFLT